ncbi:hypothetical protein [Amycolatopsis cihanbeyliensis]|uniref:Uncharacterized protein n=1 Tax=Amycolatopsis cihanbeyliensis TaxID=1128664 RepID=A0A542DJC8_AMYCI|nr:hypothetical protein [Amycolatopsis cihanbeyliensis]TQJ03065.1 hypothetical protein FB471_2815 [Amycolatopsis cihanbeyliensis]
MNAEYFSGFGEQPRRGKQSPWRPEGDPRGTFTAAANRELAVVVDIPAPRASPENRSG